MLEDLRHIVQDVNEAPNFRRGLEIIVASVCRALGTEVCSIYVASRRSGRFVFVATEGLNASAVGAVSLAADEGLVGLVAERAEPINLEDATQHPRFCYLADIGEEPFNAFLGVPVIHHRRVLGVLVAQHRERRRFDEDEEAFLITLAAQLAGIMAHAEATGDIRELVEHETTHSDALFDGVPGAPGIARGTALVLHPEASLEAVPDRVPEDLAAELELFDRAIGQVRADISRIGEQLAQSLPAEERALFDAYLHMLDDVALAGDIRARIHAGQWAQGALRAVILEHARTFEQMEDSYLRERAADVRELGQRILAYLQNLRRRQVEIPERAVLVGHEVTAAMLAELPANRLAGIVSIKGTGNSHAAILAQALGVPAVMGAVDLPLVSVDEQEVIVDGVYGEVFVNPSRAVTAHYEALMQEEAEFAEELEELRDVPCVTRDGQRIRLWVNIGLVGDITRSLDLGAEGVGLFRTEVPFMMQDRFPTEEEQRIIYRKHLEAFEPKPMTMRTLDIGGDKALSYFPIEEDNPFLGWRGIRVTLDHPEIFMVQVRAMIKASIGLASQLRIMLPLVTNLSEVDEAHALIQRGLREVVEEVGERGKEVKQPLVGVLIEVPAAVYLTRQIARKVDFLAVGTNDLTQYMLAVDRNNPRVAELYREAHPAVLHALREVVTSCHAEQTPVGVCGELAGTPEGAVLLVGMGYDVLSMTATNLPRVKWVIRNMSLRGCRRILARALRMDDPEDIQHFIREQIVAAGLGRAVPHHEIPEAD